MVKTNCAKTAYTAANMSNRRNKWMFGCIRDRSDILLISAADERILNSRPRLPG